MPDKQSAAGREALSGEQLEALFNKAREMADAGRTEDAIRLFDKLIEFDPEMPAAYYFKGITLGNAERHEEAAASFLEAYHRAPGSPQVLFNLAGACLHTGRWQAAMTALLQYLDKSEAETLAAPRKRAELLLGLAASGACGLPVYVEVGEFLGYEAGLQRDDASADYVFDRTDTRSGILYALALAAQIRHSEACEYLESLTARIPQEKALLSRAAPLLDVVARWAIDQAPADNQPSQDDGEPPEWERPNAPLREQLARLARYFSKGLGPSSNDLFRLLQAFHAANLLVPVDGDMQQTEDGSQAFGISLQAYEPFGGDLISFAFTGLSQARAFYHEGHTLNRVVVPGETLAGLMTQMAQSIASQPDATNPGAPRAIAGIVVNPAGPHPYVFKMEELQYIAAMGTTGETQET